MILSMSRESAPEQDQQGDGQQRHSRPVLPVFDLVQDKPYKLQKPVESIKEMLGENAAPLTCIPKPAKKNAANRRIQTKIW